MSSDSKHIPHTIHNCIMTSQWWHRNTTDVISSFINFYTMFVHRKVSKILVKTLNDFKYCGSRECWFCTLTLISITSSLQLTASIYTTLLSMPATGLKCGVVFCVYLILRSKSGSVCCWSGYVDLLHVSLSSLLHAVGYMRWTVNFKICEIYSPARHGRMCT